VIMVKSFVYVVKKEIREEMNEAVIIYVGKFFGQDDRDQRIFRVVFETDGGVGYEIASKDRMGRDKWDEDKRY